MVTNSINLIVECIKLLLVMCGMFNYKFKKSVSAIITFALSIVTIIIIGIYDNAYQVSLLMFISVVICGLSIEGKRKFLLGFIAFWGICCVDELLFVAIKIIFSLPDDILENNTSLFSVINSVSIILFFSITILLQKLYYAKRKYTQEVLHNSNMLYLVLFAIGQIASAIFIAPYTTYGLDSSAKFRQIAAFCFCLLCMLFFVLGVLLVYNNNSRNHYKSVAEMNDKLIIMQEKYYQMLLEKENETRKFRHDIRAHILCVSALLNKNEYEEANNYLSELESSISELASKHSTGNMLVNAILNDISCKYENVKLVWNGVLSEKIKLTNMDICTIFSNILDNAFCAASGSDNEGYVNVNAERISNSLVINVKNNISISVNESDGILVTRKKDKKNHGFGIHNVKKCVEKYGGSVEYDYSDNTFSLEITLPNVF